MNSIQRELQKAFDAMCMIFVNGDSVDLMSAAKQHIKHAFELAKDFGDEGDGPDG